MSASQSQKQQQQRFCSTRRYAICAAPSPPDASFSLAKFILCKFFNIARSSNIASVNSVEKKPTSQFFI
jgi:hypothetical protein